MHKKIFRYGDLQMGYSVSEENKVKIIALHGHGRSPEDFSFLSAFGQIIALDLFFHGDSFFPEDRIEANPIENEEFHQAFLKLLELEQIEQFHFVAFSQGGRFVLSILPFLKDRVLSLQLISPDGMDNNSFYNRMSRKKLARKLFVYFEKKPQHFKSFSFIAFKLKLMRPKVFAFVQKFSGDPTSFSRASKTWRGFRQIQPNDTELKNHFKANKIYFKLIMGRYDQVIRTQQAELFLKRINQENALIELQCGHDFFAEKNKSLIEKTLIF